MKKRKFCTVPFLALVCGMHWLSETVWGSLISRTHLRCRYLHKPILLIINTKKKNDEATFWFMFIRICFRCDALQTTCTSCMLQVFIPNGKWKIIIAGSNNGIHRAATTYRNRSHIHNNIINEQVKRVLRTSLVSP